MSQNAENTVMLMNPATGSVALDEYGDGYEPRLYVGEEPDEE